MCPREQVDEHNLIDCASDDRRGSHQTTAEQAMTPQIRGADVVARMLDAAGLTTVFTLSGNHIMSLFDAALGTRLKLIHVRQEAAAVHMADAWGRLTGRCGVALVSGGPGFTNAAAALYTAKAAESPLVLLSGHSPLKELGRGSFQELGQAEMAAPTAKASWVARSAASLASELTEAVRIALSGRRGPVHLSLPSDLLEAKVAEDPIPPLEPKPRTLETGAAEAILAAIGEAERPLIVVGPQLCHSGDLSLLGDLENATGAPIVPMESPRGLNDARLGAFAEVLRRVDLVVLLGKALDFSLRFGDAPAIDASCRFVAVDPEAAVLERAARDKGSRLIARFEADALPALRTLVEHAGRRQSRDGGWREEVRAAIAFRPQAWTTLRAEEPGKVHPIEICRALEAILVARPNCTLICEGGEIGQWPQATLAPGKRVINGPAGSIGASIPFAIAARAADPTGPVIVMLGDGSFGFHMAEFDTAVRYGLPFVAVVGNDAAWNAEHQIQLREYGQSRAHGCELLPSRYDLVAQALGGHGEYVTTAAELAPALERALASGKPACMNIMIERHPAPSIRRA
jgi:acetolactate synthase-1/2/3 large subunit